MIGERLRDLRQEQRLSLTDVAIEAHISAATLSRIENGKQALDVEMLFALSRILKTAPEEIVATNGKRPRSDADEDLSDKIAALTSGDRAGLWRDLIAKRRTTRVRRAERHEQDIAERLSELLAQVDFLRQEIELIRSRVRNERHQRSRPKTRSV